MMKRGIEKIFLTILLIIILLIIPLTSAGFWSDFKARITGKEIFEINITITSGTAPTVPIVENFTMTDVSSSGPNEGPAMTSIMINFTAYDADEFINLDDSSALINFSRTGEDKRENASCEWLADWGTYYANYTCNVSMWWWDDTGIWDITAYIADLQSNSALNTSQNFFMGTTTGIAASPGNLTFTAGSIAPGATDVESNNDPMLFNNTGNLPQYIEINSTDLIGEDNATLKLYANNFTVKVSSGCEGTPMVRYSFENITSNNLSIGNYTADNGTAQEELYFCLELAGSELSAQAYSTSTEGSWNSQIIGQ